MSTKTFYTEFNVYIFIPTVMSFFIILEFNIKNIFLIFLNIFHEMYPVLNSYSV